MNEYEDYLVIWQDLLDEVMAGRSRGLKCPECGAPDLEVEKDEAKVSIRCRGCGRTIQGRFRV